MLPSSPRRPGRFMLFTRLAAFLLLAATSRVVLSDDTPSPEAPAKPSVLDRAPSERAKRDAEKVFHWIKIHADKPRKAAAVAVEKPAPAAPVKVADKPAPKPADSGITETVEPIRPPMAKAARPAPAPAQPVRIPADNAVAAASAPAPRAAPPVPSGEAVASARLAAAEVPPTVEEEPEQVDLVPILQSEPEFPAALMRRLRKGLVKVSFTVLSDGSVSQAQAVSSSHSRLEPTALATVSKWRFQPVRQPQEAVVELGFDLD